MDWVLSTGTLLGHLVLVLVLTLIILEKKSENKTLTKFVSRNVLLLGFLATMGALLGSLYYSEIVGFEPCRLCWIQRIFLFPQIILFGIALWRKHYFITLYSLVFSIIGGLVALYQYLTQMTGLEASGCSTGELAASCSQRLIFAYGYITIPLMSLTLFIFLILINIISLKNKNEVQS